MPYSNVRGDSPTLRYIDVSMSRRVLFVIVGLALFAAACTSEGLPNSYEDQNGRAETQFIAACEAALADSDTDDPADYCQCAFDTVAAELTYDEFLVLDDRLKDDPENLNLEERNLLESVSLPCAFSSADRNDG